ncbi:hypothetical protein Mal64_09750 [Pseudobythopirellula maris]|uniref:Uncharacterized protein n=1 Tax=Pseudobythopirellula maris TaxID=2527991 RepID=A0A5C5ZUJ4_9BACT|nr:circularly permuted type 2 ATP-grasp protein [Pseudobythopirellula maris]TWT90581.1 hypothetical protein Mal64_09750 [Pseudobythopirellula maris]
MTQQHKPMPEGVQQPTLSPVGGAYNEAFGPDGKPRPHWVAAIDAVGRLGAEDFAERAARANRILGDDGATFDVFAAEEQSRGPLNLDLLPLLVSADEWATASTGLTQRARLLEAIVEDVYGPQRLLKDNLLPPEAVFRHTGYFRQFHQLRPAGEARLLKYTAELARSPNGDWWVMADRTDATAGSGFALENRLVTLRCIPQLVHQLGVRRLAAYFTSLREAIVRRGYARSDDPRVVLLTAGSSAPFYFEDVFLARYLGYTLVEGGDLTVHTDGVYMKTLDGLVRVDVIYSRGRERGLDPLAIGGAWSHGVAGLLEAIRSGAVALVNTPGAGFVEAPIVMAFLPKICRALLGEELKLPSIATWWFGDPAAMRAAYAQFDNLVIKPAYDPSGGEEIVVGLLTPEGKQDLRRRIEADPGSYVAQELVVRSVAPVDSFASQKYGHVAIRSFLCRDGDEHRVMPGGLVRVEDTSGPMELAVTAGDRCKDLWVLAAEHHEHVSLLPAPDEPVPLRRTGALFPSRVADNLLWLGRSIERTDYLCRLLRATNDRLSVESDDEFPETAFLTRALVDAGQLDPGFAIDDLAKRLPLIAEALPKAALQMSDSGGLLSAVAETRRLVISVRDWLSHDTWRYLHGTASHFLERSARANDDLSDLRREVDSLLAGLAASVGLIETRMTHGPAWRFLDLGRQIEAALTTIDLLRAAHESGSLAKRSTLKALLEVVGSEMTYRVRYLDRVEQHAVLDLLVIDDSNPQSVLYQVALVAEQTGSLPAEDEQGAGTLTLRNEVSHRAADALALLHEITLDDLSATPPTALLGVLDRVETVLGDMLHHLTRRYLSHSGPPRLVEESPPSTRPETK